MNLENWTSLTKGLIITDIKHDEKEHSYIVYFNAKKYFALMKNRNTIKRMLNNRLLFYKSRSAVV